MCGWIFVWTIETKTSYLQVEKDWHVRYGGAKAAEGVNRNSLNTDTVRFEPRTFMTWDNGATMLCFWQKKMNLLNKFRRREVGNDEWAQASEETRSNIFFLVYFAAMSVLLSPPLLSCPLLFIASSLAISQPPQTRGPCWYSHWDSSLLFPFRGKPLCDKWA